MEVRNETNGSFNNAIHLQPKVTPPCIESYNLLMVSGVRNMNISILVYKY